MADQLDKHKLLDRAVTAHPASKFLNRVGLEKGKVKFLVPIFTISHFLSKAGLGKSRIASYLNYRLPMWYDKMASRQTKKANVLITWAWSGLETIKKIKAKNGIAIVEECGSCNRYQNEILTEEYASLGLPFRGKTPEFMVERELQEVQLADYVLCPSRYVANSFISNGVPAEKCIVIPYGNNPGIFKREMANKENFTILFVGTIGVRKGLIYLFRALELLRTESSIKCLLIGTIEDGFQQIANQYSDLFTHIPRVPHHELSAYYNKASLFVFPSIDEGMAYVQLEAMACGLPVICTFNSGGDSVVTDGEDGYIVPIRDPGAIADKISELFMDPDRLKSMSLKAASKAKQFTWDSYGDKLASFIESL